MIVEVGVEQLVMSDRGCLVFFGPELDAGSVLPSLLCKLREIGAKGV